MEIGYSNISSKPQPIQGGGQSEQLGEAGKLQGQTSDGSSLSAGKIFQGEILDIKGSQVSIGLDNGQVLIAKMETDVNLSVGQKLLFEVKSNINSHIEIKPALDIVNPSPVLQKALQAANITLTERNMEMVNAMIKEGMSIDKKSLTSMLRQLNVNSDTDAATIVKMNKLGIVTTPENIEQFENYKNYEHRIVKDIDSIANNIVKLLSETIGDDKNLAVTLNNKLVDILNNNYSTVSKEVNTNREVSVPLSQNTPIQNVTIDKEGVTAEGKSNDQVQMLKQALGSTLEQEEINTNLNKEINRNDSLTINSLNNKDNVPNKLDVNNLLVGSNNVNNESQKLNDTNVNIDTNLNRTNNTNDFNNLNNLESVLKKADTIGFGDDVQAMKHGQVLENILSSEERFALADKLKNLGADLSQLELVKEGKIENKELLNMVKTLINDPINAQKAEILFSSKEYNEILRQVIKQQWLVEPDNLNEPDKMTNLYKQMDEQTKQISAMLESIGKEASSAFKDVSNVRSNINFMEQINQNFTYIQIPVQFTNEEAHSDLYVYTNKKNLNNKDGNLSVLLHLDMEVLGTTDIYIQMNQNNVSAKFSLGNKEAIELVEDNLGSLIKRLEEKGYHTSAMVGSLEKEQDFVEDFLEKDKVVTSLKRYAFDVRT